MAKFHPLTVKDVTTETKDSVSIAFDIPQDKKEIFHFIQGQYVTLKINVGGEELRRSYSICSSPVVDDELRIAVKRVAGGRASNFINEQVKPGDVIEVMPPMGNFNTQLDKEAERNYVLFAGGSGITPMISILKTILHIEEKSSVTLFYGNENEEAIIFRSHLDNIANKYPERVKIFHILNNPMEPREDVFKGIMSPDKVSGLLNQFINTHQVDHYFICGPQAMMNSVENTLIESGIPKEKIHLEYFTVELISPKKEEKPEGPTTISKVTVILDGAETTIDVPFNGDPILDAALDSNLDVPFACKGAVCCTCKAKLLEGKVEMEMNYALSDAEVEEGFILTCQSHPVSPVVVVDYDQV